MRPQHDAAENQVESAWNPKAVSPASMRPQHDAAENFVHELEQTPLPDASMRPQHDAAENF